MLEIIPFSPENQEEVVNFLLSILEGEQAYIGYSRPDLDDISSAYQKDGGFWIALLGGELVGTIGLESQGSGVGYIRRMAVKRGHRRQGIGKQLLDTLMQFAKKEGFKKLYAGTTEENENAIRFYEGQAFVKSKTSPEGITAIGDSISFEIVIS